MRILGIAALLAACQPAPTSVRETTPSGTISGPPGANTPGEPGSKQQGGRDPGARLPGAGPKPMPTQVVVHLLPSLDTAPIIKRFAAVYGKEGRPRIAIFFNRTLSDEVREWVEPARTTITSEKTTIVTSDGDVYQDGSQTTHTTRPKHNPVTKPRDPVAERMAWQIESAFSGPLLGQGARLIDRATIMRLVALASGQQHDPRADFAIKVVEMAALVGHSDYYVEVLVLSSSSSPLGYDLRAVVKGVKTGQIIADLSTVNWTFNPVPPTPPPTRRAVATSTGYEYVDVPSPAPRVIRPTTTEVATRMGVLALDQIAIALEHGR